jgi:hypothetical protein
VLFGLLLLVIAGSGQPALTVPNDMRPDWSDPQMFQAVVGRMAGGASYHAAMGAELRAGNYPVRSTFNWRLPTLYGAFAHGARATAVVLPALLAALLLASIGHAYRLPLAAFAIVVMLQIGAMIFPLTPLGRMFTEPWAGALLALAVLAYGQRWHVTGAVLVLAGLFVRELAAPFALVCGLMALRDRRWREVAVWMLGGAAFLAFYGWHAYMVQVHLLPSDPLHASSWVQFGGLRFILSAIGFGSWFPLSPPWVVALAGTSLVASLWSPAPRHLKVCVATYLAFFSVAGQAVNGYWGLLVAPTWALAIGYGPLGVRELWKRAA